jgi:glycerol-3-phosphate dehydrogenase (NAD(P)+)
MKVAVLGGGAWGTALGCVAVAAGHEVILWARDQATVDAINTAHRNQAYLPDVILPETLRATNDSAEAFSGADIVLAVTPAQTTRQVLTDAKSFIWQDVTLVLCAKGIESSTGAFLSDIAKTTLPNTKLAFLSGPGFAGEIARGLPSAVTLASREMSEALKLAETLSSPRFRIYASDDIRGVEAGGAMKNIIAIAAGAVHGAGLGASASAALVTRGFAELKRVGEAFGGKADTLNGLSGLGDLILTCNSTQSRNFQFGVDLAQGRVSKALAEGAATAHIAAELAQKHQLDAPIIAAISAVIKGQMTIENAVTALMARPLKEEN